MRMTHTHTHWYTLLELRVLGRFVDSIERNLNQPIEGSIYLWDAVQVQSTECRMKLGGSFHLQPAAGSHGSIKCWDSENLCQILRMILFFLQADKKKLMDRLFACSEEELQPAIDEPKAFLEKLRRREDEMLGMKH